MARYLLEYDAETKTEHYLHVDAATGKTVLENIQDAEDILEFNKVKAEQLNKKEDWWFIGSIPLQLCQQWAKESGTKVFTKAWQKYARKKMQDPDYRKLNPNNIKLGR